MDSAFRSEWPAASKLDAAPLAILLPGAFILRYWIVDRKSVNDDTLNRSQSIEYWTLISIYLIAGAVASIISFRIFMPYAFHGLGLNPAWIENMKELVGQSSGDVDVPFALQWARRSHLFSFDNLTIWGLGLPLGILAWIGFLVMLWRIIKGELQHLLLWGWTAIFFAWQSMAFNPTMRYQLPIYPLLCMMAGWFVIYLWDQAQKVDRRSWKMVYRLSSIVIGAIGSGPDFGLGLRFHTNLYPACDARRGNSLDLSKRSGPHQPTHHNLGWYRISTTLAISIRRFDSSTITRYLSIYSQRQRHVN